jgi:thioredoxin-dependent peroxiredoxin
MAKNFLHWIIVFLLCIATIHISEAKKSKLKPGDLAPAFVLQGDDGKTHRLSDFNNQKVVLFFYPLDNSPQCTKEACSLAQAYDYYKKNNIQLFGINHESVQSHLKFKKKHNLPFILLSDPSCDVIKAYGAYSSLFIKRITFLIDKGRIVAILRDVDVKKHADQILKAYGLKK